MNKEFIVDKVGLKVKGILWKPGDPFSAGKWTAIDTETYMIDETKPSEYPDVVVLTSYGGGKTVDLVTWEYIDEYLDLVFKLKPILIFHNAPFDINVLGIKKFIPFIDAGRILDTGIQWVLSKMGTVGLSDEADEYPKLSRVVQDVLGQELEKDSDVRCTFERERPLDEVHAIYACGDAVATYLAALAMAPDHKLPPTMDIQIKGFISLDSISHNGMLVDKTWMRNLRNEYIQRKDDLKLKLADLGINVEKELETKEILPYVRNVMLPTFPESPKIDDLRLALTLANRGNLFEMTSEWITDKKQRKEILAEWIAEPPFHIPVKHSAKQLVNMLWKAAMNYENGIPVSDGMQAWWDQHDGWPSGYKQVGTTTQLQQLMGEAEQYLSEPLPRTESGMIALDDKALESIPKEDLEKLKFLKSYKEYKHAEKMVSTYLDEKIIKADGRVHSRMIPLKSTGRTSSRSPNVQNLPRDDRMRGIYVADPGYVMCSCDYNQQELIALAQVTYTRFGHSLMRDLINNDIDIHGFMGTTIKGLFKELPKFNVNDPEIVAMYTKIIKGFKSSSPKEFKSLRQMAKALDFGLPGGLGAKTLIAYARNYNVELTMDEAVPLCKLWKDTFPETVNYLENPGPELDETAPRSLPTDDPKTRKLKDIYRYKCVTLTGRKRARCSYTQACNTGFQGLASDCTKTAMWNIYKSGYPMCNMIHDETITLIPFDPLTTQRAAHIQELMVNSMQLLTPDVKVKAEPALMFRWAKSAEPYFFRGQLLPWEIVPKKKEIKKGEVKISPIEEQDLTVAQITELTDTIERLYEMSEKARKAILNT